MARLSASSEKPSRLTILKQDENLGFARANNIGAAVGRGQWLALLNPDAEAEPGWLAAMMHAVAEHPGHRMVASLQFNLHDPTKLDGAGDNYLAYGYAWRGGFGHPASQAPRPRRMLWPMRRRGALSARVVSRCGRVRRALLLLPRGRRYRFPAAAVRRAMPVRPRARVSRHAGSAITGRTSRFAVFHGVRNGVWTYFKNMPGGWLVVTLPIWFFGAVLLLIRGLFRGRFHADLGWLCRRFRRS